MDDRGHSVTWEGRTIPYTIRRVPLGKYEHVDVRRDGTVGLRVPMAFDQERADALVAEAAPRIVQELEGVVCSYTAAPHNFVTGENVSYLGGRCRLTVLPGETGPTKLRNRRLEVPVRKETRQAVRSGLISWFRGKAEERLPARVEAWHGVVGVSMPPVVIEDGRKRLGSCGQDGSIHLNWRLIQLPVNQADFVVVHQLLRLLHGQRERRLWKAFERVMADCHLLRQRVEREKPGLFW